MIFQENNKKISFSICSYEFPKEKSSKTEYNYDANWLNCKIKYTNKNNEKEIIDPCLLTYELLSLTDGFSAVLEGRKSLYRSNFMEPVLKISIRKLDDKIKIVFTFFYDILNPDAWKMWRIINVIDKQQALQLLEELKEFCKTYPER